MPNRYIREGIITSEAVCSLSWAAEVYFRRLLNKVDDFGRYTAHPSLMRAALYPLQLDKVREADTSRWLAECEEAGLVFVYQVEGKRFIAVNKWERGRAVKSHYPDPPAGHDSDTTGSFVSGGKFPKTDGGLSDCEHSPTSAPKLGANVPDNDTDYDNDTDSDHSALPRQGKRALEFDIFWTAYPKKKAKGAAEKAWKKVSVDIAVILQSLEALKRSHDWTKDGGQFIPYPATWLNDKGWEDEVGAECDIAPSAYPALTPEQSERLRRLDEEDQRDMLETLGLNQ